MCVKFPAQCCLGVQGCQISTSNISKPRPAAGCELVLSKTGNGTNTLLKQEAKGNLLQSYKRCEDILLDKNHVMLPELQRYESAYLLRLYQPVPRQYGKAPAAASLAVWCGAALRRGQGGQLDCQDMRRAVQAWCKLSVWRGQGEEKQM